MIYIYAVTYKFFKKKKNLSKKNPHKHIKDSKKIKQIYFFDGALFSWPNNSILIVMFV